MSNPPYIPSVVVEDLDDEVRRFDPRRALDGGSDGLDAYRAIASGAAGHLAPSGVVGFEIGYDQKEPVTALMSANRFRLLEAALDLGGQDRALIFAGLDAIALLQMHNFRCRRQDVAKKRLGIIGEAG